MHAYERELDLEFVMELLRRLPATPSAAIRPRGDALDLHPSGCCAPFHTHGGKCARRPRTRRENRTWRHDGGDTQSADTHTATEGMGEAETWNRNGFREGSCD